MIPDFLAAFDFALELNQVVVRSLLLAAVSIADAFLPTSDMKKPRRDHKVIGVVDAVAGTPMYTLQKAKEEIDAVAKHATDIAVHALAMGDKFDVKLESFKKEIIDRIDAKFAELEKMFLGDTQNVETTAVADLGAKVSELLHGSAALTPHDEGHREHHEGEWHEPNAEHHH